MYLGRVIKHSIGFVECLGGVGQLSLKLLQDFLQIAVLRYAFNQQQQQQHLSTWFG